MKCPTCGGDKKDHTPRLWLVHINMHKAWKKTRADIERSVRQARIRWKNL